MQTVAVESNYLKPFTHAFALGLLGFPPRAVVRGFFHFLAMSTVPHTITSTPDCGGVGGKRFTLTQGGRVHEGSAPSDKRVNKLMCECRTLQPDPINKAAEHIKGQPPMWTPTGEGSYICVIYTHHRYRSPCIV